MIFLFEQPSHSKVVTFLNYRNKQFQSIHNQMSKTPKDAPAHNYAKPVPELPPLTKEVSAALSNQHERNSLSGSSSSSQYKTYLIAHNQAYYRGPWAGGLPHGKGCCIFADGSYYEGNFQNGEAHDQEGHLILSNGASYHGSIRKSAIDGQGEMRQSIGSENSYVYKGSWSNGRPHGFGKEEFGDGSKYEGQFVDGVKCCYDSTKTIPEKEQEFRDNGKLAKQGKYRSASGEQYVGQFFNGRMHGFGSYSKDDGKMAYTGQFHNGKKQGYGSLKTSTGVLTGYFKNDLITGSGRFEWGNEDGRVYEGNFKDSKFHGEGQIRLKNGNVLEGIWEDGHSVELRAVTR